MKKPPEAIIYPGLARAMEGCGVTQRDIARVIGVSDSGANLKVRGKINISVQEALAIQQLFPNWTIEDLFAE